ncbi:MAG TPA: flavin reductase family protein [Chloroflexota bacterium]|jgi:flavin reductase (DIM6/NTAB) family NADH-FMN oxidoreductase RutF|nr:flavin reductase family protein [Chloroflexota bacterium]
MPETMPVDPMEFRRALGCFATGVTVITAMDTDGKPRGLTANAFSSLSLDPTLVLVCVDHRSDTFPVIGQAEFFAINILGEEQREISQRFARKGEDKFEGVPFRQGQTGAPIIEGALAVIECLVHQAYEAGDHTIFIGNVQHVEHLPSGKPLLFFRGNYASLPEATPV